MTHIEPQISQKTNTSKYAETFLVWQAFAKLAKLAVNTPRPAGLTHTISRIIPSDLQNNISCKENTLAYQ